jgi:hypothetical protein
MLKYNNINIAYTSYINEKLILFPSDTNGDKWNKIKNVIHKAVSKHFEKKLTKA